MIKLILLKVAFVLFVYTSNSQSLSDFLHLRLLAQDEVMDNMNQRKWHLYDEDEQRKNDILVYTFKLNDEVESMVGIQWVDFVYRPRHVNKNRISFQIQNTELYEKYITEMIELGFKLHLEKAFDNHIIFVYNNDEVVIEVITSQNKYLYDGMKYYNFAFYNQLEYNAVFKEENEKYSKKPAENVNAVTINYFN